MYVHVLCPGEGLPTFGAPWLDAPANGSSCPKTGIYTATTT